MTFEILKTSASRNKALPLIEISKILSSQKTKSTVVKSPLRYPGGKSRAVKIVRSLIPFVHSSCLLVTIPPVV